VNETIQILKKVTLSLMAGSTSDTFSLTGSPVTLEFIYGVASDGLCSFESFLYGRREGSKFILSVPIAEAHEFFGHVYQSLFQVLGLPIMPETLFLKIEITSIVDPDNREVVQSLARSLMHDSCSGSCGCGCG
jgi:hypothetical protein